MYLSEHGLIYLYIASLKSAQKSLEQDPTCWHKCDKKIYSGEFCSDPIKYLYFLQWTCASFNKGYH